MTDPHLSAQPSAATLEALETLVAFPTVSRDSNLGLIEWARDRLARLGARCRLTYDATGGKANLFATLGAGAAPGLVLSGHTDVVPVDGQDWATDPFRVTRVQDRIHGRGTADMKGFLAVVLARAPVFADAMQRGLYPGTLHVALSYDEEIGCIGVHGLIADLAQQGIRPAGCIIGEPTGMSPVIAHKGKRDFRCCVSGREAHSALTPQGVNAIEYAARLIVAIRDIAERMARTEARQYAYSVPYTTLSTNRVVGGIANNVVPRDCEFMFEYRWLPGTDPDGIEQEIRARAAQLAQDMRAAVPADGAQPPGIAFERISDTPHFDMAEDADIVRLAQRLARNAGSAKVAYGTEAGLFQRAGIPTVVCGPGSIEVAHRPDEYVTLAQLAECEAFLDRLIGVADS